MNFKLIEKHVVETEVDPTTGRMLFVNMSEKLIYALHADKRKKVARERYLMTAQVLTLALAPCDLKLYPLPLI